MSIDAMFEARSQNGRPGFHVPFVPLEADGAILEEWRWREPMKGRSTTTAGLDITLSRWSATHGDERTECSVTPDHCHIVALTLTTTQMSLWTQSKQLFEGSLPPGTSRQRSGSAVASTREAAVRFSSFPCCQSLAAGGGLCSGRRRSRAV